MDLTALVRSNTYGYGYDFCKESCLPLELHQKPDLQCVVRKDDLLLPHHLQRRLMYSQIAHARAENYKVVGVR